MTTGTIVANTEAPAQRRWHDIIVTPDTLAIMDADYDFEADQLSVMRSQPGTYSADALARQAARVSQARRQRDLEWAIWNGTVSE